MTTLYKLLFFCCLLGGLAACEGGDIAEEREGEVDPAEVVASDPDYEDGGGDADGEIDYVEQSARSEVTAGATNYSYRQDSILESRNALVEPKYTDDEYEAAYSTSTTNPNNQVEGGVTPGNND